MRFLSTRNPTHAAGATLVQAIERGLAPDGGLYVPQTLPQVDLEQLTRAVSLPELAQQLLLPFVSDDALESQLGAIVREAFDFPAPLTALGGDCATPSVLELFHGPTAAFKDFGARFLAGCLARRAHAGPRKLTILVATSGDTGGAVAAAFHRRPGVEVVVLYPLGLVSPRQEQQLTCWGENVRTLAVRGSFDDCQRLVKAVFLDPELQAGHWFSSANSINIGRLLPQMVYYAAASLEVWRRERRRASFIVPSGNLGNSMAAIWAREMGLPIADLILAHNANRTVPDFLATGQWQPRPSIATLASAMDVGNPSNMERLRNLYPTQQQLRAKVSAVSVTDADIRARIRADFAAHQRVWCPHSAVAAEAYARLPAERRDSQHWVLVATAHPAKFNEIVEPLIGREVAVPAELDALLALPRRYTEVDADLRALKEIVRCSS